jgi:hypothetical protein
LQSSVALHAVVHWWAVGSQALPEGQSLTTPQPHVPPCAPAMHTDPMLLPLQMVHVPPVFPQPPATRPGVHVPPAQQPPLHGCIALHELPHVWVVASQAAPAGQSVAVVQPHTPAMHA